MLQSNPSTQMRELTESLTGAADAALGMPRRGGGTGIGLVSDSELGEFLRAGQKAVDVLRLALADAMAEFADRGAYRDDGASSIGGWAETALHLTAREARGMVRAHETMRNLPDVGAAARGGEIGLDHVLVISGAITRDGLEAVEAVEPVLVDVARKAGPKELNQTLRKLHEVLSPDELDDAYAKGMDKHDIRVERVGHGDDAGYSVTGWLDSVTGARFRTWLDAASAPRPGGDTSGGDTSGGDTSGGGDGAEGSESDPRTGDEDTRTAAQRRVDAFGDLLDSALRHGMPHDRGVRPQMVVTVDAETLLRAARAARDDAAAEAEAERVASWTDAASPDAASPDAASPDAASPYPASPDPASAGPAPTDRANKPTGRPMWPFGPLPVGLPADLAGHGLIGPALLGMFACEADISAILVRGDRVPSDGQSDSADSLAQADVLNVGRSHRLATPRQRRAVLHRQGDTCGNPTCTARHLDVHHVAWWDRDHGRTDLDNLIALCSRCHALVHTGRLVITADGHGSFTVRTGRHRLIPDTRRQLTRWIRQRLRQALSDPPRK